MPGGRPLTLESYGSPEDVLAACERYIAEREAQGIPVTITGLALALDIDRRTLLRYRDGDGGRKEFCPVVKRAVSMIEDRYEQRMHGTTPVGSIFALKNMGWSDRQQVDLSHSGAVQVTWASPAACEEDGDS